MFLTTATAVTFWWIKRLETLHLLVVGHVQDQFLNPILYITKAEEDDHFFNTTSNEAMIIYHPNHRSVRFVSVFCFLARCRVKIYRHSNWVLEKQVVIFISTITLYRNCFEKSPAILRDQLLAYNLMCNRWLAWTFATSQDPYIGSYFYDYI